MYNASHVTRHMTCSTWSFASLTLWNISAMYTVVSISSDISSPALYFLSFWAENLDCNLYAEKKVWPISPNDHAYFVNSIWRNASLMENLQK